MQQREEQMHLQQQAHMRHVEEQDMHEQQFGNDEEDMGRGGALVEEAKRLMADDGDEMPAQNEAGGPKIKMGRLGKRGKKPADGVPAKGEEKSKSIAGGASAALSKGAAMHPSGGFNEKAVVTQVTNGKNAMPAFGGRLSDDDIANVATYVISTSDAGWD